MSANHHDASRRSFLKYGAITSAGFLFAGSSAFANAFMQKKPNSKFAGVQVGAITYSFRSMPGSIEQILQYIVDCNLSAVELMGDGVRRPLLLVGLRSRAACKCEPRCWR